MYVYVCVCVVWCLYLCAYMDAWACECANLSNVYMFERTQVLLSIHSFIHPYTFTHLHTGIPTYLPTYVHTYICTIIQPFMPTHYYHQPITTGRKCSAVHCWLLHSITIFIVTIGLERKEGRREGIDRHGIPVSGNDPASVLCRYGIRRRVACRGCVHM